MPMITCHATPPHARTCQAWMSWMMPTKMNTQPTARATAMLATSGITSATKPPTMNATPSAMNQPECRPTSSIRRIIMPCVAH